MSSSRSVVVGPSVGPLVRLSVGDLCEKVTFRVLNGNLNLPTYLPIYLCDSSDSSDSCDSCDSCDSSDSSDSSEEEEKNRSLCEKSDL